MTARSHVALRLAAVAWIGVMAYLPRGGAVEAKPDEVLAPAAIAAPKTLAPKTAAAEAGHTPAGAPIARAQTVARR